MGSAPPLSLRSRLRLPGEQEFRKKGGSAKNYFFNCSPPFLFLTVFSNYDYEYNDYYDDGCYYDYDDYYFYY